MPGNGWVRGINGLWRRFGDGLRKVIAAGSGGEQDALAEQAEARPPVHLPFDHLDPVHVAFDRARAVGQGQPGGDGLSGWGTEDHVLTAGWRVAARMQRG